MDAIDLYSARFWGFVAVVLLVLVPQTNARVRRSAFAALNLGFLVLYTRPGGAGSTLAVVAGVVLIWLALQRVKGRLGVATLLAGGVATLGLFLLHKLPHLGTRIGAAPIESVLATIGFSYVALRLVDVARAVRDGMHPPPDLPSTINYLMPFHMLAAGPIQSYEDFVSQPPVPPPPSAARSLRAIERIAWGLTKKFILANFIDRAFLTGFHAGGPFAILEMNLNYVWLFLDFSAYSDVAVGLGMLMGVATPENFNAPFLARNQVEYWERWHISLSQFIRRNLFIPIQLSLARRTDGRRPLLAASLAFTVSFVLCGVWHSVSLPWLAWGILQSLGLIVCNLYRHVLMKRLGRKGVNAYLADRRFRVLAIVLTFEFNAFVVAVATFPYRELHWWTAYPS